MLLLTTDNIQFYLKAMRFIFLPANAAYQHFNIVHTLQHVLQYPSVYQLSCTTPCFCTHMLLLAATRFGVY